MNRNACGTGVASVWQGVSAAARRNAQNLKDYADLRVFKSIEAILWQPDHVDRYQHSPVRHVQQVQASTACNQKGTLTMSNITLTAGSRQNFLALQNTSAELTTTQEALATGKKVNTAFDNPTSFFTSQSLNNRANDLSALLDQIGQAQQTLDAANNGLPGLTSLVQQALSTAQQAQQTTPTAAAASTGSIALTTPTEAAGSLLINVGATSYTVA